MTPRTLLFIHDFACGGEAWNDFSPLFENDGWNCETPTLFHHLRTIGAPPDSLVQLSLGDYVRAADDYARCIANDDQVAPVVIGHGLGGLIAQKLVERKSASAGVFIAPFAPADCGAAFRNTAIAYANILLTPTSERRSSPVKPWRQGAAWGLLNGVDADQRTIALDAMRHEPGNLVNELMDLGLEATGAGRIDEQLIDVPTLTIYGGRDKVCLPATSRKVAQKYANALHPGDSLEHDAFGHWMISRAAAALAFNEISTWLTRCLFCSAEADVAHAAV